MNPSFVIVCSIAMTWLFREEVTEKTAELFDQLADEAAIVPTLWFLEVANVLSIAERKKRITLDQSTQFVDRVAMLDLQVKPSPTEAAVHEILPLCRAHRLTSYDAVLSRTGSPLSPGDTRR